MKRSIAFICFLSCSLFAFSQINKGQWLVGGDISFSHTEENLISRKTSTFALPVNTGYFITNNLAIGIRGSFTNSTTKGYIYKTAFSPFPTKQISMLVDAGIFIRYYLLPRTSRINLLVDGAYTHGFREDMVYFEDNGASKSDSKTDNYQLNIGPAFFINPHVSLELLASYRYTDYDQYPIGDNKFSVGAGLQIHLGKGKEKK